ncbi:MAG: hypothetical protein OXP73_03975 [Chloroflexota bacterium]|nr:hypothetical protein [Chloroflexota bacterium]
MVLSGRAALQEQAGARVENEDRQPAVQNPTLVSCHLVNEFGLAILHVNHFNSVSVAAASSGISESWPVRGCAILLEPLDQLAAIGLATVCGPWAGLRTTGVAQSIPVQKEGYNEEFKVTGI